MTLTPSRLERVAFNGSAIFHQGVRFQSRASGVAVSFFRSHARKRAGIHQTRSLDNSFGVRRDAETMAEVVRQKIEDSQSTIRMAESTIERMREAQAMIAAGDLDNVIL